MTTAFSGWLKQRAPSQKFSWSRKWFVLAEEDVNAALVAYTDDTLAEPKGEITISRVTWARAFKDATPIGDCSQHAKERPFGFILCSITEMNYLEAKDEADLAKWLTALNNASTQAGDPPPPSSASSATTPCIAPKTSSQAPVAARKSVCNPIGQFGSGVPLGLSNETCIVDMTTPLTVVLFGATGDLARKKLYPALYQLMFGAPDAPLLPQHANIVGYGRSSVDLGPMLEKQCVNIKGNRKADFLKCCTFFAGAYDKNESFVELHKYLGALEGGGKSNRLYFLSIPPTIFGDVVKCIDRQARAPNGGWTRLVIEKPFGRDSRTFKELNDITKSFDEDQIYRIDHYLGKEVVLNLVTLRFGNQWFEPLWSQEYIESVQIVFKEDLGTEGRGGYFDNFGIIRDIMQNHLLQVFVWLAMEPPAHLDRVALAREKVKLLQAVGTVVMEDCFLGQFGRGSWNEGGEVHEEPGYLDDKTVPEGSMCPTYAGVVLRVNNSRWKGVPFLFRAGKGLDERCAEVRVTFKQQAYNALVPGQPNELVMRIQPDEAIYLKCSNKVPGWLQNRTAPVVLDMSYRSAFPTLYVADAYERMFLNTCKGDGSLFVGSEELVEAWRIFTPLLDEIDAKKPKPVVYPFGARVPAGMDDFAKRFNITMSESWQEYLAMNASKMANLRQAFDEFDKDKKGRLDKNELRAFARRFFDNREPTDAQLGRIMRRLDTDSDGYLSFEEVSMAAETLNNYLNEGRQRK